MLMSDSESGSEVYNPFGECVDYPKPPSFLLHKLGLLLSLFQELQLSDDANNRTLADDVDLCDVEHDEQEVQFAHRGIFQHDKWGDVLEYASLTFLIIEVDRHIPEVVELYLLSIELSHEGDLLNIVLFLGLLSVDAVKLGNLELFVADECNEGLEHFRLAEETYLYLSLSGIHDLFAEAESIEGLQILSE